MLVIQKLDDGLPGVTVVDIVAEAGGIDDGQADCRDAQRSAITIDKYPLDV